MKATSRLDSKKKDLYDLIFKVLGFSTIVLAWLSHSDIRNEQGMMEAKAKQKEYADSLKSIQNKKEKIIADFTDSLHSEKELALKSTEMTLHELQYYRQVQVDKKTENENYRDYLQKNQLFERQWANTLMSFDSQRNEERNKVYAQAQLALYFEFINTVSSVIENVEMREVSDVNKRKVDELVNKIRLFKDDSITASLMKFKTLYSYIRTLVYIKNNIDSLPAIIERFAESAYFTRNHQYFEKNRFNEIFEENWMRTPLDFMEEEMSKNIGQTTSSLVNVFNIIARLDQTFENSTFSEINPLRNYFHSMLLHNDTIFRKIGNMYAHFWAEPFVASKDKRYKENKANDVRKTEFISYQFSMARVYLNLDSTFRRLKVDVYTKLDKADADMKEKSDTLQNLMNRSNIFLHAKERFSRL